MRWLELKVRLNQFRMVFGTQLVGASCIAMPIFAMSTVASLAQSKIDVLRGNMLQVLRQDSQGWVFNRLDAGSERSMRITSGSIDSAFVAVIDYTYNGGSVGWMGISVRADGTLECVVFHDERECRSPSGDNPKIARLMVPRPKAQQTVAPKLAQAPTSRPAPNAPAPAPTAPKPPAKPDNLIQLGGGLIQLGGGVLTIKLPVYAELVESKRPRANVEEVLVEDAWDPLYATHCTVWLQTGQTHYPLSRRELEAIAVKEFQPVKSWHPADAKSGAIEAYPEDKFQRLRYIVKLNPDADVIREVAVSNFSRRGVSYIAVRSCRFADADAQEDGLIETTVWNEPK